MKKQELKEILTQMGIPPSCYNFDGIGRTDERFCLDYANGQWRVYFCERGIYTTDESFASEEEACRFLYEQLV